VLGDTYSFSEKTLKFTITNPRRVIQSFTSVSNLRAAAWRIWEHHTTEIRDQLFTELRRFTQEKVTHKDGSFTFRDKKSLDRPFEISGLIFGQS